MLQNLEVGNVFVESYLKEGSSRFIANDFSTNLQKWIILKPLHENILNISDKQNDKLLKMEALVDTSSDKQINQVIKLNDTTYYCNLSKTKSVQMYVLMCSEI